MELQKKIITGVAHGPHLLITGAVHGNEFEPMLSIRRLMKVIDPAELRGQVTLVPVVNEAAFENRHRAATDGLDLARTCPGRVDGSITERIAWSLSELIAQPDYYIDLHTGGTDMAILPMSGYMLHRDPEILEVQRRLARAFNLPIIWGTSPDLDGRSMSMARDANIPAIYIEHGGGGGCNPEGVDDCIAGCLNVMGELGMIDREPPRSRVAHFVEEDHEDSGYMQIQNPAPIPGYFEPAVALGQRVAPGDLIGTVSDVLGDHVEEVRSSQTGIVLMLKTFPRVDEGDGLAVVLKVE